MAEKSGMDGDSDFDSKISMVAETVPFHVLCETLEFVSTKKGRSRVDMVSRKSRVLAFIKKWRECHAKIHKNDVSKTVGSLI